ncbi:MAG: hypothetical protein MUD08_17535, partial [Cytophagales bacterium]|nr:hypothetical protein [Cytophagales bacterium]
GQLLPVFRTSSVQTKNRLDVTAVHDDNISDALVDCLKQFAHINIDERLAKVQAITSEEANKVYEKTEDFLPFAILNDTVIRRGFYKSIDEFRNNTPSFTGDFEIYKRPRTARSWEGEFDVSPYFPTPDGKRRIVKNMWGFSDGQTCYFKYKGEFYALTREGNNFTFYGHRAGSPVGVTVGQAAFGVIGAAVVVSVSNDDIKTKFLFDTQSGRITFYDDYLDAETETIAIAKVVAYYPKAKNQNTTVDFSLANRSDTLSNPLAPNSSVELEWTLDRSDPELSACLNTDTNCLRFVPRMDETTYIEITFDSKSNRFVTEVVNSQKATFYLKKIKSAQEAEARRK